MSLIKFYVLANALMPFCILFSIYGLIAVGMLSYYKAKFDAEGADVTPFLGLFVLETIAWLCIVLS